MMQPRSGDEQARQLGAAARLIVSASTGRARSTYYLLYYLRAFRGQQRSMCDRADLDEMRGGQSEEGSTGRPRIRLRSGWRRSDLRRCRSG